MDAPVMNSPQQDSELFKQWQNDVNGGPDFEAWKTKRQSNPNPECVCGNSDGNHTEPFTPSADPKLHHHPVPYDGYCSGCFVNSVWARKQAEKHINPEVSEPHYIQFQLGQLYALDHLWDNAFYRSGPDTAKLIEEEFKLILGDDWSGKWPSQELERLGAHSALNNDPGDTTDSLPSNPLPTNTIPATIDFNTITPSNWAEAERINERIKAEMEAKESRHATTDDKPQGATEESTGEHLHHWKCTGCDAKIDDLDLHFRHLQELKEVTAALSPHSEPQEATKDPMPSQPEEAKPADPLKADLMDIVVAPLDTYGKLVDRLADYINEREATALSDQQNPLPDSVDKE